MAPSPVAAAATSAGLAAVTPSWWSEHAAPFLEPVPRRQRYALAKSTSGSVQSLRPSSNRSSERPKWRAEEQRLYEHRAWLPRSVWQYSLPRRWGGGKGDGMDTLVLLLWCPLPFHLPRLSLCFDGACAGITVARVCRRGLSCTRPPGCLLHAIFACSSPELEPVVNGLPLEPQSVIRWQASSYK